MGSNHECTNVKEAMEKLRKGMHIMIRPGTHEKNLQDLIVIINELNSSNMSLVSEYIIECIQSYMNNQRY